MLALEAEPAPVIKILPPPVALIVLDFIASQALREIPVAGSPPPVDRLASPIKVMESPDIAEEVIIPPFN